MSGGIGVGLNRELGLGTMNLRFAFGLVIA